MFKNKNGVNYLVPFLLIATLYLLWGLAHGLLFSYYEYVGEDYEADMAKMAADPETQRWWDVCMPCQRPLETRAEGEWWATMEEGFYLE